MDCVGPVITNITKNIERSPNLEQSKRKKFEELYILWFRANVNISAEQIGALQRSPTNTSAEQPETMNNRKYILSIV